MMMMMVTGILFASAWSQSLQRSKPRLHTNKRRDASESPPSTRPAARKSETPPAPLPIKLLMSSSLPSCRPHRLVQRRSRPILPLPAYHCRRHHHRRRRPPSRSRHLKSLQPSTTSSSSSPSPSGWRHNPKACGRPIVARSSSDVSSAHTIALVTRSVTFLSKRATHPIPCSLVMPRRSNELPRLMPSVPK